MTGLLACVVAAVAFYLFVYRYWDYKKKFTCKSVLIYLSLGVFVLMLISAVTTVGMVYENEQDKTLAKRMDMVQFHISRGDYSDLAGNMAYEADYEPEFEYVWERLEMYETCGRYLVFSIAAPKTENPEYAGMAEKYEKELIALCSHPGYAENADYGEYYLRRAGITSK